MNKNTTDIDKEGYYVSPEETYRFYVALKAHFNTPDFDFTKFGHKLKSNRDKFNKRNDAKLFLQLSNKYNRRNIVAFLVANFIVDPNIHISNLLSLESNEIYLKYEKRHTSISRTFEQEMVDVKAFLDDNKLTTEDLFSVKGGKQPLIFRFYMQGLVCIETFLILDSFINLVYKYDSTLQNDYAWTDIYSLVLKKYKLFFKINKEVYKKILIKTLK